MLAIIISLPVLVIMFKAPAMDYFVRFGIMLWLIGFLLETVADYQLAKFQRSTHNRGKILTRGLWRYSRHPNYLGEIIMWWAIAVIALPLPYGWVGIVGAVTITMMLNYITGIPVVDSANAHKEGWEAYRKRTPKIVPKLTTKL